MQVKSERLKPSMYAFFRKADLGDSAAEMEQRLRHAFALSYLLFREGSEPELYLVPGSVWLKTNGLFVSRDYTKPGQSSKPEFGIALTKAKQSLLDPYKFSPDNVRRIVSSLGDRTSP